MTGKSMKRLLVALCLAAWPAASFAADAMMPSAAAITKEDKTIIGQPIEVPKNPTVLVSTGIFPPGMRLPVHKHLYAHYVYVLEGTLTVTDVENGKSYDIGPGHFLVEMLNTWHYGENRGTVPVRAIVIDQVPQGVTKNMVLKDAP